MAEKEYIEREAAIEEAIDAADEWDGGYNPHRAAQIRDGINAIPAADIVEVVRCRNCRYFETDAWANVNGTPIIVAHEMCRFWGGGYKTNSDAYCSYGRKIDG